MNQVSPPPPKVPWTSWKWPGNTTRQLVVVPHVIWEALFRLSEVPLEAQLLWGHTAGRALPRGDRDRDTVGSWRAVCAGVHKAQTPCRPMALAQAGCAWCAAWCCAGFARPYRERGNKREPCYTAKALPRLTGRYRSWPGAPCQSARVRASCFTGNENKFL